MDFTAFGLRGEPGGDAFWATAVAPLPVAEGEGWRTLFLWRGSPATLVFASHPEAVSLRRWGETDCWYAEVPMPAELRATYQFHTADGAHADPLNPVGAGPDRSIVATPDAPAQPHWPAIGADEAIPLPRTRVRWRSERLGTSRTVRVHPAGGGGPLVLLLDGDDWLYLHPAMAAFDSAITSGESPPVTLVYLPVRDREAELGCRAALWEAVRDELLPLLADAGFPARQDKLVVAGQSLGGLSALYAALEFPDLVSRVACQSGSFWWTPEAIQSADPMGGVTGGVIAARLRERPGLSGLRIAFDVGGHETGMLPHCELVETLAERAGATVRVSRSPSGHDPVGWRQALLRDVVWALG